MGRVTKKMGYISPFGKKSLFVEEQELEEKVVTNLSSKKLKMYFEVHIVHNQDAFEVLRKRPKRDNYLHLYVRKKNKKEILNTKVSKLEFSGITFDDIEPLGVTLSKNILEKLLIDKSISKDIINDLAEWMNINKQAYDFDRNDILTLLEEHLLKYSTVKNYTPPNALELVHQVFLMCIRLGVVDLSNTTGYISNQVFGAFASHIRSFKLEQETWNPNIAEVQYKDIPFTNTTYSPLFSSQSYMINAFATTMDAILIDDVGVLNLPKHEGSEKEQQFAEIIINGGINIINDIIIWFKNTIIGALKNIRNNIDHYIKLYNAYTVGFINGIIEFIAGIVDGVGGLIGLFNYQNHVAITKAIDKFLAELSWEKIGEIISKKLSKLFAFLIGDEAYKNAYEFGLFIPKIFEIVLDIIGIVKSVARIAKKFIKAKEYINAKLDDFIHKIQLPDIDRKATIELKEKYVTIEVEYTTIQKLSSGAPVPVREKDFIFIKYKDVEIARYRVKKDPIKAKKQNERINKEIKKLNEDPEYLYTKVQNIYRKTIRATPEFKKIDKWFADNRPHYMIGDKLDLPKVTSTWDNNTNIIKKELKGKDLEELKKIKNSKEVLESKNIAKGKIELEIDGKDVDYEYIEHSGKGTKIEGAKGHATGRNVKDTEFHDPEFNKGRKDDSEPKIIELMNEDIASALAKGKKVTVKKVTIQTTYDPCNVCKKELLLFQEQFKTKIVVERPFFIDEDGVKTVVKGNDNFKKLYKKNK